MCRENESPWKALGDYIHYRRSGGTGDAHVEMQYAVVAAAQEPGQEVGQPVVAKEDAEPCPSGLQAPTQRQYWTNQGWSRPTDA